MLAPARVPECSRRQTGAACSEVMRPVIRFLLACCSVWANVCADGPLQLSHVCHARGSASAWVSAKHGSRVSLVECAGAIETNGTHPIYAPDLGAPIIVVMPPGAGAGVDPVSASPRCVLQTDRAARDLNDPVILVSHTMTASVRHALLCLVPSLADPAFPGGIGPPPQWAKLKAKLDHNEPGSAFYPVDGLPVWFFGLTAPPHPAVTWSGGGALITLTGFNLAIPGAVGSAGEGGGGGTAGAAAAITGAAVGLTCRFYLNPATAARVDMRADGDTNGTNNTNTTYRNATDSTYRPPWYVLMATGGALPLGTSGSDSLAVTTTRNTTVCPLPPLPRGFVPPVKNTARTHIPHLTTHPNMRAHSYRTMHSMPSNEPFARLVCPLVGSSRGCLICEGNMSLRFCFGSAFE